MFLGIYDRGTIKTLKGISICGTEVSKKVSLLFLPHLQLEPKGSKYKLMTNDFYSFEIRQHFQKVPFFMVNSGIDIETNINTRKHSKFEPILPHQILFFNFDS